MPKVTMYYRSTHLNESDLLIIGTEVRKLVAAAASTNKVTLTPSDVDWIPQFCGDATFTNPVSIEIETIGYPERKQKLSNKELLMKLKSDILRILEFPPTGVGEPLIWVKYVDPDGLHI